MGETAREGIQLLAYLVLDTLSETAVPSARHPNGDPTLGSVVVEFQKEGLETTFVNVVERGTQIKGCCRRTAVAVEANSVESEQVIWKRIGEVYYQRRKRQRCLLGVASLLCHYRHVNV
jgi:hypothetical protein